MLFGGQNAMCWLVVCRMMAALESLWRETCVLDPAKLGQTVADVAQTHFSVYIIYCSNAIYQNRKLTELMSVFAHLHLFKQDTWISLAFFRKHLSTWQLFTPPFPPSRYLAVTSRLKKPTVYPRPNLQTNRYYSTVSYTLLHFQ